MFVNTNTPFTSPGQSLPFNIKKSNLSKVKKNDDDLQPAELSLPRCLNYLADYSGCGHWRLIWPEQVLNAHAKAVSQSTTVMILDERYYINVDSVRIQRQATPQQLEFVKILREIADKKDIRLIYEIDDICFSEDIPDYNKYKTAFEDPSIRKSAQEIMAMCDEITVTCDFMRDYYKEKTGNKKITVIPNFMPRFWLGYYYDPKLIMDNLQKNKKKPRILYVGSGAHFDVDRRVKFKDDFYHVNDVIRKTVDQFQWVFMGGFPLPLHDLIRSGKIEFHPWKKLYEYGQFIKDLNINMMIAPLQDNNFNKSKSDLKYIEASAFGIPIACQDLCTYKNAPIKFNTGEEMIDQIKKTLGDSKYYKSISKKCRSYAETRWLELDKNIDCYLELYTTEFGSEKRVNLKRFNH